MRSQEAEPGPRVGAETAAHLSYGSACDNQSCPEMVTGSLVRSRGLCDLVCTNTGCLVGQRGMRARDGGRSQRDSLAAFLTQKAWELCSGSLLATSRVSLATGGLGGIREPHRPLPLLPSCRLGLRDRLKSSCREYGPPPCS